MAYTIQDDVDTTDLGRAQIDSSNETAGITQIPLPESDADEALLIPILGPLRTFTPRFIKTGTLSALQTFIAKASKWVGDGGKLSKANITYNSDLDGTGISARVNTFTKTWNAGNPTILDYTLEIIEGSFT